MRSTFSFILLIVIFCHAMIASHHACLAITKSVNETKETSHAGKTSKTPKSINGSVLHDSTPILEKEGTPAYFIEDIILKGNERTRNSTMLRELPFEAGDSICARRLHENIESARNNLINTGLFNFVETDYKLTEAPNVTVTIDVVERWNIWPLPILQLDEPNLNQWLDNPSFSAFNYGIKLHLSNMTGLNERVRLSGKTGNVQSLEVELRSPYMGSARSVRWGLQYKLDRSKKRAYGTEDNEQLAVRLSDEFISNEYLFAGKLQIRPRLYSIHTLGMSFRHHNYADTLLMLNSRFGPDGKSRFSFFTAGYSFRRDHRDIAAYPLQGHLFEGGVRRKGLGLLSDENMDVTSLFASFRHYTRLAQKWYAAWSIFGKWSEGTTLSYFDREGLGFNRSLVRGYENYIIDGHKFFIFKSNIKYNLMPERDGTISFIPYKQFSRIHYALYMNIFADVGIIDDRHYPGENNLANRLLAGTGVGLDFHTYYDIVFRSELTINRHGEVGVFFHLSAPI